MSWLPKSLHHSLGVLLVLALGGCASLENLWDEENVSLAPSVTCVQLTPESVLHPVGSCEKSQTYEFLLGDEIFVFNKREFRNSLRHHLFFALQHTDFPMQQLQQMRIEVWTLAPVFAPTRAELVAVVTGSGSHHFAVNLPIDMRAWQILDDDIVLLGAADYPSALARRAGQVVVELAPYAHTLPGLMRQWLGDVGADAQASDTSVLVLKTRAFGEAKFAQALSSHPAAARLVRQVHYVPAGQKEGNTALSFSFPFLEDAVGH